MRKIFLILFIAVLFIQLISCSEDSTEPTVDETLVTVSDSTLDFGTTEVEQSVIITPKSGKSVNWRVERTLTGRWIEVDVENGTGTKTIKITINRSRLAMGRHVDTIKIIGTETIANQLQGKSEVTKKIVVVAEKISSYIDAIESTVGNEVILPSTYFDSSYCFFGSFEVQKTINTKTAIATFFQDGTFFKDIGLGPLTFSGKTTLTGSMLTVDLIRQKFTYTKDETTSFQAFFYMPDGKFYVGSKGDFNDVAFHKFIIPSGLTFTEFTDSVKSVSTPDWTNNTTSMATTADISISWTPTSSADDSVFVVLTAKSDSNFRVSAARAVNDDAGSAIITSNSLQSMKLETTDANLWIIRFRVKIDQQNKRVFLVQSQKYFPVTLN